MVDITVIGIGVLSSRGFMVSSRVVTKASAGAPSPPRDEVVHHLSLLATALAVGLSCMGPLQSSGSVGSIELMPPRSVVVAVAVLI